MSDRPSFSRRQMLVGTGLAGAAAATAGSGASAASATDGDTADPRRVELKDTPHTRAYYALARD